MSTLSVATLSELRTLAQQYADMVNNDFVTTSEWNTYINLGYFKLYNLLVEKYGDDYFATNTTFTTDGTTYQFTLPSDFFKFLGLDLQLGNVQNSWVTIRPFMFGDRNRYAVPNFQSFYGVTNLRYRVFADTLFLTPIPAAGQTLRMWYVPRMTELTSDSDTVDGISGFQEYIALDAAEAALRKQEDDVSQILAQKAMVVQQIESAAGGRDAGNPQTVTDTQSQDGFGPAGNWNGGF